MSGLAAPPSCDDDGVQFNDLRSNILNQQAQERLRKDRRLPTRRGTRLFPMGAVLHAPSSVGMASPRRISRNLSFNLWDIERNCPIKIDQQGRRQMLCLFVFLGLSGAGRFGARGEKSLMLSRLGNTPVLLAALLTLGACATVSSSGSHPTASVSAIDKRYLTAADHYVKIDGVLSRAGRVRRAPCHRSDPRLQLQPRRHGTHGRKGLRRTIASSVSILPGMA